MGMRITAGRNFRSDEDATSKPVKTVVNQAFVDRFFPNIDPVGRLFGKDSPGEIAGASYVILGVVTNAKYRSLREPMGPIVFIHRHGWRFSFWLRAQRANARKSRINDSTNTTSIVRNRSLRFPFLKVDTGVGRSKTEHGGRATGSVACRNLWGTFAAFLAAVSIYGLLAYLVALRELEVGLRVALGARQLDIGLLIGKQALAMIVGGLVLGVWVRPRSLPRGRVRYSMALHSGVRGHSLGQQYWSWPWPCLARQFRSCVPSILKLPAALGQQNELPNSLFLHRLQPRGHRHAR